MEETDFVNEWSREEEGSDEEVVISVDSMVAIWWKRRQRMTGKVPKISCSPGIKSTLAAVKKLQETKSMIKDQVSDLKKRQRLKKGDMLLLACLLSDLGDYDQSLKIITQLLDSLGQLAMDAIDTGIYIVKLETMSDFRKEALWQMSKIQMQVQSQKLSNSNDKCGRNDIHQVERVPDDDLSVDAFKSRFSSKKVPVVITGCKVVDKLWSLDHIKETAGHIKVTLKKGYSDSIEWARLESSKEMLVANYIDSIKKGESEGYYLFDWSLPLFCPGLFCQFSMPPYVKDDYLKKTSQEALYRSSWPSLFVSGKGTVSELHVDAFGSNFWMYLFSGQKRWTFFHSDDVVKLKPKYYDSLDPVFEADISNNSKIEDYEYQLTTFQVTLGPGELLFVPHGSPHRVENLEDSVAVSGNYVDDTNVETVIKHLRTNALRDPRSYELLKEMNELFNHSKNT